MKKPRMPRFFNTAGPNNPADHYTLPVLARLPELRELIDQKSYFVIHAPRQTGKTTLIKTMAAELNVEGQYTGIFVSMESGAAFLHDPPAGELSILDHWRQSARVRLAPEFQPPPFPEAAPGARIRAALGAWAQASTRPLVVFIDEIDALEGSLLISVLRQIREGYNDRPKGFPWSLALIGMRNVRDYKFASGGASTTHSSSPFNIVAKALTLSNFTQEEVKALYGQHTEETGQVFLPGVVEQAFVLTQGQPWLVNALANEMIQTLVRDRSKPIGIEQLEQAKENLILRQDTHLDSLAERLREPRIRAIIEPMLSGELVRDVPEDDIRLATDLGLLRVIRGGRLEVANPMYREIIIRNLSASIQRETPMISPSWLGQDGKLKREALLASFMQFWRQHGEVLMGASPYHEAAPHLVLMAFLHRVVNGGGVIEREYATGMGRMDLCVRYGGEVLGIEVKVWRDGRKDPEADGLAQLDSYLTGLGQESGWLLIFDKRAGLSPVEERLSMHEGITPSGRRVAVVRA